MLAHDPNHPILIVEDDRGLRLAMSLALEDAGYAVAQAVDGAEALEWLSRHAASLVVTDVLMPRLGGSALVSHVRHAHPDTPVILLSGRGAQGDLMGLGATDILRKPVELDDLLAHVERALAPC